MDSSDQYEQLPDFNAMLVENPAATFVVRVAGHSITGAGIFAGDIAVVNRERNPVNGSVVVALLDGAFTLKRLRLKDGQVTQQDENSAYPDTVITGAHDFEVWGVVAFAIRRHVT